MKQNFRFDESFFEKGLNMKAWKAHLLALVITLGFAFVLFYLYLPALSFKSEASVLFIAFFVFVYGFLDALLCAKLTKLFQLASLASVAMVVVMFVLSFLSTPLFQAKAYQQQIQVEESSDFTTDFKEIAISKIPVVDKDVAIVMGDKKLGEVQGLGSQYSIDTTYTLVSIKDNIYRVAPLIYRDVYKWLQNRSDGIPAYVRVNVNDPTDVELISLPEGMKISPSGYLQDNLMRHVRFAYPTLLIQDYSFEVDDNDHPYWVVSIYEPKVGFYGGLDAVGVIIVDPMSGDMSRHTMEEIPSWVDRVQPAEFAIAQIDNWGYYIHGFFNTFFGQKDMLQITDGYNYVVVDGNTHLFSGITSVGSDQSIVGFTLIDLRNKLAKFYRIGGADEYAAMNSAQGQVQHLGYRASFPIILNVKGTPSYFVSLKDQEGLVKKYAFVAVQNYSYVGVGDTVKEAELNYLSLLKSSGINTNPNTDDKEDILGNVSAIHSAIIGGNTVYYLTLENNPKLFVAEITLSSELALTKSGDQVKLQVMSGGGNVATVMFFDNFAYDFQ